jgi:hypothetical protein
LWVKLNTRNSGTPLFSFISSSKIIDMCELFTIKK